jgi:hypothetical protein
VPQLSCIVTRLPSLATTGATCRPGLWRRCPFQKWVVRIHQTLKITPAMAAGVTSKLWEMADMVKVLEDWELAR